MGFGKGTLLSPLLFIIGSEALSRLLGKEEAEGNLHSIKVDRNSPSVSHLMYANDMLVMARADKEEAESFKKSFDIFCHWSGHEANMEKSSIFFSKSIKRCDKKKILECTGFKDMGNNSIYLGNALIMGRNRVKDFSRIRDRVVSKLEGWNRNLISKAGKAVLIQSVIQAIPSYTMATFRVPYMLCKELDMCVKKLWWSSGNKNGRYMALRPWEDLCKPKIAGGLGFRRFVDINIALLAKLAWKIASEEDSLWCRIMRIRKLEESHFSNMR